MGIINILDDLTINKIAAGEVVERPSSVVKELIENSIDANAKKILVEIENGGKDYIKVSDDGSGILDDDLEIAFKRHTTSKIKDIDDIEKLYSNGFRGEALSSISSVSKVKVSTNTSDSKLGKSMVMEGGKIVDTSNIGKKKGTSIEVSDLFFNIPARKKFLKSNTTETSQISDIISRLAIANNDISFRYISNKKTVIDTVGDGNMLNAISSVYGKSISESLIPINFKNNIIEIQGYISKTNLFQSNRKKENIFINKRYIKLSNLYYIIENIYNDLIPIGKYPVFFINIDINPKNIDPNVHPSKLEVKISEDIDIASYISDILRKEIFKNSRNLIPNENFGIKSYFDTDKTKFSYKEFDINNNDESEEIISPESKESNISKNEEYNHNVIYNNPNIKEKDFLDEKNISKVKESSIEYKFKEDISEKKNISSKQQHIFDSSEIIDYTKLIVNGVLFNTYIITTFNESIFLIDQHAAHERVMYEKIRNTLDLNNKKFLKQELLVAEIREFSSFEHEIILKNKDLFSDLGFEIDDFGFNRVAIRTLPIIFNRVYDLEFFEEILSYFVEEKKLDLDKTFEHKIATMACKSAVKGNWVLNEDEINILLLELQNCENKYTCPHGRPIFTEITRYNIEKMFKRVM